MPSHHIEQHIMNFYYHTNSKHSPASQFLNIVVWTFKRAKPDPLKLTGEFPITSQTPEKIICLVNLISVVLC